MKKLIVDKNHKKIDTRKIGNPLKRITSGLLAGGMALSMYTGTIPKVSADETQNSISIVSTNDDREIDLGDDVYFYGMGEVKIISNT